MQIGVAGQPLAVTWGGLTSALGCFQPKVQCWSIVRLVGAADLQHLAVARPVLQARPADWSLASELGWFDQCSWLLSTPRLAVWTLVDLQCCNLVR